MSNWAENPQHSKQSLMTYSLPKLLFQECHNYCVDFGAIRVAQSEGEIACLANCQAKTYQAFNLYMEVQTRFAASRSIRSYVDVSNFTGMEIEHQHDTASQIPHLNDGHVNMATNESFFNNLEETTSSLKREAL